MFLYSATYSSQIVLQSGSGEIDTAFGSGDDHYPNDGMHIANLEDNGHVYRAINKV